MLDPRQAVEPYADCGTAKSGYKQLQKKKKSEL